MNERVQDFVRQSAKTGDAAPTLRPVDAFVVGGEVAWESGQNVWLLLARPGERLIDFFLEDDEVAKSEDPAPCACGGVLPDGTLVIDAVDWEMDRFLSELLDDQESSSPR